MKRMLKLSGVIMILAVIGIPSLSGQESDPDRPIANGRVANTSASGKGEDRPTESVSFNFTKIKLNAASVRRIYEYGDLIFLVDDAGNSYSLPDGIYSDRKGDKILLKGKKILQNYTATASSASGMPTGKRTHGPVAFAASGAEHSAAASTHRRIQPARIALKSAAGRYTNSDGSWFEVKGETITAIGGLLYKHNSLPFVPADTSESQKR